MEIVQGIVIGVTSGLTLGFLAWIQNRFVRCEQIQYIRKLIIKERERVYSAQDLSKPFPTEEVVSKHVVRVTLYRAMRRDLFSALDGRASQLSFDEKTSITSQFGPIDWVAETLEPGCGSGMRGQFGPIDWVAETPNKFPPFQLYTRMFSEWEKQAWLNLPAYEGEIPTE